MPLIYAESVSVVREGDELHLVLDPSADDPTVVVLKDISRAESMGYEVLSKTRRKPKPSRFDRLKLGQDVTRPKDEKLPLMKDLVGKLVILQCDTTTKGGTAFEAGEILLCSGTWRDMVHLEDPKNPKRVVRRVSRAHVRLQV